MEEGKETSTPAVTSKTSSRSLTVVPRSSRMSRIPLANSAATSGIEVGKLLDSAEFVNALPGHLAGDEISQARVPMVLRTLNSLRGLGPKRSARRRKKKRS